MGGDGGVIATKRAYFVKVKKAAEKRDPVEVAAARWSTCALTNEPLHEPIVACELGRLYNKSAILAHLLSRKPMPKGMRYIKGLKNLVTCKLTHNTSGTKTDNGNGGTVGAYVCPISGVETNGKHQFVVLRTCGHVLSSAAMKEIPSSQCLTCNKPFDKLDVIVLCPDDKTAVQMKDNMIARRKAKKAAKALKAAKAAKADTSASSSSSSAAATTATTTGSAGGAGGGAGAGAGAGASAESTGSTSKSKDSKTVKARGKKRRGYDSKASEEEEGASAAKKRTAGGGLTARVLAKAASRITSKESGSSVYSNLFHSNKGVEDNEVARKNLFIRTATNVWGLTKGR